MSASAGPPRDFSVQNFYCQFCRQPAVSSLATVSTAVAGNAGMPGQSGTTGPAGVPGAVGANGAFVLSGFILSPPPPGLSVNPLLIQPGIFSQVGNTVSVSGTIPLDNTGLAFGPGPFAIDFDFPVAPAAANLPIGGTATISSDTLGFIASNNNTVQVSSPAGRIRISVSSVTIPNKATIFLNFSLQYRIV